MVAQIQPRMTVADFEIVAEESQQIIELLDGEIYEVPSNPFVSEIANLISFFFRLFLREKGLKGHITGADGGYIVNGDVYAPDVAYISYERQPELAKRGFNPNPPELAVEVISDTANGQEQAILRRKVTNYLRAGVVLWVVDPDERTVEVYVNGQSATVFGINDTLTGGDLLPNFKLPVKDIFPPQADETPDETA